MDTALAVHRLQFAFTVTFHYLFPLLTMGIAPLIVYYKTLALRRDDERYARAARFWAKIFGINFVLGVVTGIPMEFQFGTNWSRFSRFAGGVIGQTLAMEGMFAFFLESSFLGLVSVIAPVIATGTTAVVIASEKAPLPALSLGEVLATSDLPGGVVNVLSGRTAEIAAPLAAHQDVNAIDLAGADESLAKELEIAAADNLKRVRRPQPVDYAATPGTDRLTAFLETKTVWHPTGSLGASGSSY